ncbi:MAG: leucine-rich repeat domain-containing protein [Simkaniaceae bacterium]|nr:leucine-rich repeat domain-containing protein [Simkaniaceae bacterium]
MTQGVGNGASSIESFGQPGVRQQQTGSDSGERVAVLSIPGADSVSDVAHSFLIRPVDGGTGEAPDSSVTELADAVATARPGLGFHALRRYTADEATEGIPGCGGHRMLEVFLMNQGACVDPASPPEGWDAERARSAREQAWVMLRTFVSGNDDLTIENAYALCSFVGELGALRRLTLKGHPDISISLPEKLWELDRLEHMDLHNNGIRELSSRIGHLINLLYLNLAGNLLCTLPSTIGNLICLCSLDLGSNRLQKLPPEIGNLVNLGSLNVHGNRLKGLPSTIIKLEKLVRLLLGKNGLEELPEEVKSLKSLVFLDVSGNRLRKLPLWVVKLRALWGLNASHNLLEVLPPGMYGLSVLEELYLNDNLLSRLPWEMQFLPRLMKSDVSNNPIRELPQGMGEVIERFYFEGVSIEEAGSDE